MRYMAGIAALAALVVLASILGGSGSASSAAPVSVRSDKLGPLAVELVPRADVTATGVTATADLHVQANISTGSLHVTLATTGSASIVGPTSVDISPLAAGATASVPVTYAVAATGEGEVHAAVTGAGGSETAIVYALGASGEALHGRSGPVDLELDRLDRDHASGKLDDASYAGKVLQTGGGGASEVTSSSKGGRNATLSGVVRWTDRAGNTHPVRLAPLYVFEGLGTTTPVVSTRTALDGSYSVPLDHKGAYFVQVFASSPGVVVRSLTHGAQYMVSFVHPVGPGTNLSLDLTANNVDDNDTAFSVADAYLTSQLYVQQLRGTFLPRISVFFPSPYGTFFDPRVPEIHLLRLDRFDWDVSMHEFGHYFARALGIDRSLGGPHGPGNLSEFFGKAHGIPLAFNEGWATYFSITAQQVMGTASYGIPFVGDTRYSDTEDYDLDYDLETQTGGFASLPGFVILSTGEDDEITDQRILWDLFDSVDDDGDHGVALGAAAVVSTLEAAHAATLSEAYAAFTAGRSPAEVAQIGCIFTEHRVAPAPTAPAAGARVGSQPPTLAWVPNGGGPSFRNNSFVVQLYDATFTRLLLSSTPQSATSFTPTRAQWRSVVNAAGGGVHWVVRGTQLDDPVTGPYGSCSRVLAVG